MPKKFDENSAASWLKLFNKVNADCVASSGEEAFVPLSDIEHYAEQIWNLTNEGDLPEEKCEALARQLRRLERIRSLINRHMAKHPHLEKEHCGVGWKHLSYLFAFEDRLTSG